jgi:hypothetical protein
VQHPLQIHPRSRHTTSLGIIIQRCHGGLHGNADAQWMTAQRSSSLWWLLSGPKYLAVTFCETLCPRRNPWTKEWW